MLKQVLNNSSKVKAIVENILDKYTERTEVHVGPGRPRPLIRQSDTTETIMMHGREPADLLDRPINPGKDVNGQRPNTVGTHFRVKNLQNM